MGCDREIQLLESLLSGDSKLDITDFECLLAVKNTDIKKYVFNKACEVAHNSFGGKVYLRGLVEISNCCRCGCYYCGLRSQNSKIKRYRLNFDEIINACQRAYKCGLRTFVLQGGEDLSISDTFVSSVVSTIKEEMPDSAVTLSLGERSFSSFEMFKKAGADRYLLRHETASKEHYAFLHPEYMSYSNRIRCLYWLKDLGYEVGVGMMIGSPGQTLYNLAEDLMFISEFNPEMIGVGPFIPAKDTPFENEINGSISLTMYILSLLRLLCPKSNIPATTALISLSPDNMQKAIKSGANVIMPNITPLEQRSNYKIYNGKTDNSLDFIDEIKLIERNLSVIGYEIDWSIGNYKSV